MTQLDPSDTTLKPVDGTLEPVADKLLVEEYKACRDLIGRNIDIIEKTEVYAVGAIAASATFSLAATDAVVARATCWIPFAISALGLLRYIGIDSTIHKINNYLSDLEEKYALIGWTKSYRKQNKWKILKATRYVIWIVAVLASLGFASYILFGREEAARPSRHNMYTLSGYDKMHGVKLEVRVSN